MSRIVLTGGPGAGKTVIAKTLAARHPQRLAPVPEAATQVYDLLRTTWDKLDLEGRRDAQRRIYRLQVQQEQAIESQHPGKILLLDRGTIDGAAYWPHGPADYWRDLGTDHRTELMRYQQVIWLETCAVLGVYDGSESNACRFEDAAGAIRSGELLKQLWRDHPRLHFIPAHPHLAEKIAAVEELLLGD